MRDEGVIYVAGHPLGDVQDSQGISASKMTDIVSGRALISTHSVVLVQAEPTCNGRRCGTYNDLEVERSANGTDSNRTGHTGRTCQLCAAVELLSALYT